MSLRFQASWNYLQERSRNKVVRESVTVAVEVEGRAESGSNSMLTLHASEV